MTGLDPWLQAVRSGIVTSWESPRASVTETFAREELDIANSTIQGLQAHVDELKHKLSVCEQQLVQAEAVKQNLTRELEEAHAEMQRLLANIQALEMQTKELEAQLVIKDDEVRELKYKLDLCPYKCKKVEAPAPAPPPPELEPEDDPTKYVGVGMVVRVETGKSHMEYCNGIYVLFHTESFVHDDYYSLDGDGLIVYAACGFKSIEHDECDVQASRILS